MTEAFNRNIIFPNKKMEEKEKMHKGHWLDSETYIGRNYFLHLKFKEDAKLINK